MQHEEHTSHRGRFGNNTNGLGILIVTVVSVCLALFCWSFWKDGSKEIEHYRLNSLPATAHGNEHEEGEKPAGEEHETASALVNPESAGKLDTTTGNFILNVGDNITITLPDSAKTTLQVGANSTEAKLFHFLSGASIVVDSVDKTKGWITCDRIYFETGKANLTPESKKQINNIALILKAFPMAALKVGGYTDNTGSAEVNVKVSTERATTVQKEIMASGGKNASAAEGYGPEHPIASNNTKEGQALNRRVDLRVTKK
jgi:OOP family OmpA-OmpF porin